jgi:abortive infection bacteriophage resistance protein
MRCYNCGGFGHKAQDYWNSRRQSMRNDSYNTTRRVNETWKKNEVEIIEYHRTKAEKPRQSRM